MSLIPALLIFVTCASASADGENSFDRLIGTLSKGTHYLLGNSCESRDEKVGLEAMTRATAAVCAKLGQDANLNRQSTNLQEISAQIRETAEDKAFAALAYGHALDLKCAAGAAHDISQGAGAHAEIVQKILLVRDAKLKLASLAAELASKGIVGCVDSDERGSSKYPSGAFVDPRIEGCRSLRIARTTYQALYESVPLSGAPSVKDFLEKAQVDRGMSEESAAKALKHVYAKAESELKDESERLVRLASSGGDKIDRPTRRALVSDPKKVQDLVDASGGGMDARSLACDLNARYGSGANELENAVTLGSIVLTPVLGAGGLAVRGAGLLRAAAGARAAGTLSLGGARLLQLGVVASGGSLAYENLDRACWSKDSPQLVTRGETKCRDNFSVEQIHKEDCRLAGMLTALGGTALLASSTTAKNFVARAINPRLASSAIASRPVTLETERLTSRFAAYQEIRLKQEKLGPMFGENTYSIRDASVRSGARDSYVQFAKNPPDQIVNEPYISIDMVRGNKDKPGFGQFLIRKVTEENPGVPIYGALARENGARFKAAFRNLSGGSLNEATMQGALQEIPALRSIPGRAVLKPSYNEAGELVDIGVLRYPDYSRSTVEFSNLREVVDDPRFRRWMENLKHKPPSYFEPNPEFK